MSKQWSDEITAFTRAFSGAAIFGIPLVFTMEMWWIGKSLSLSYLLAIFAIGFVANLGLAHVAGFRETTLWIKSIDQAIDAMAVGVVSAAALLIALNQLRFSDGLTQSIGMIMLLGVPLSLGASVARQIFSGRTRQGEPDGNGSEGDGDNSKLSVWQGLTADIGATIIGGVFIGMTIAPTDEIPMIASALTQWHLFALIGLSLLVSYIVVFASGFDEESPGGLFQHPFTETMLAYVISLVVSFGMLVLFEHLTLDDPLQEVIRQTVVLALPATIGGAGGRLVI